MMDVSSSPEPSPSQGFTSFYKCNKLTGCLTVCVLLIVGAYIGLYFPWNIKSQQLPPARPARMNVYVTDDAGLPSDDTHNVASEQTLTSTATAGMDLTSPNSSYLQAVKSSNPTDLKQSFFTVKQADPSMHYLCDTLELHIEARDQHNRLKTYGGDYFWVKIFSPDLEASQPADEIIDHQNGTYTAHFILRWTGVINMEVVLIKSSEYVALLRHQREIAPARFAYDGRFSLGTQREIMPCHITKEMYLGSLESQRSRGFCDFSDRELDYPWFCLKPKILPCSSWSQHMGVLPRGHEYNNLLLKQEPVAVIHKFAKIRQTGVINVKVISVGHYGEVSTCTEPLPACVTGLAPRPPASVAGFYFKNKWYSLVCQLRDFHKADVLKCLTDRRMYFYGDSTVRQWFEYLSVHLGHTMQEKQMQTSRTCGPRIANDQVHNISLFYRHHGYPIRNVWTNVKDIRYAAHEIDNLQAGPNTIILLTFWAHFTPTSIEFYRERWKAVKNALRRLRKQDPNTIILIKSANTREQQGIDMSNWYAMELDKVMREELLGEPGVTIIDVWDMTLSHLSGHRIHPLEPVISQEVKVVLNFLCPSV